MKAQFMDKIKLPSLVHYELILQILERQTMIDADRNPVVRERLQQLIVTLRKALSQHKLLEDTCEHQQMEVEHIWALNSVIKTDTDNDRVEE
jgi:predicted ATPase